jgi:hypothetical protein
MLTEREIRMQFGEFDCGCDGRRQIMGADNWQLDITTIGIAIIITVIALVIIKSK